MPIIPGNTTIFKNRETGCWCRLLALEPAEAARLQVPPACATQGVVCDQPSWLNATTLTYLGEWPPRCGCPPAAARAQAAIHSLRWTAASRPRGPLRLPRRAVPLFGEPRLPSPPTAQATAWRTTARG